jgi:hypothetical protein
MYCAAREPPLVSSALLPRFTYSRRAPSICADGSPSRRHHAALAGDQAAFVVGAERGEGDAAQARHRQQHRLRVVGEGDVELRTHLLRAPCPAGDRAVDRALLAGHFLQTDLGEATEQPRRQRLAVRVEAGDAGRIRKIPPDRADHAALHQHVGAGQRAARAGGVHPSQLRVQHVCAGRGVREQRGPRPARAPPCTDAGLTATPPARAESDCAVAARGSLRSVHQRAAPSIIPFSACAYTLKGSARSTAPAGSPILPGLERAGLRVDARAPRAGFAVSQRIA